MLLFPLEFRDEESNKISWGSKLDFNHKARNRLVWYIPHLSFKMLRCIVFLLPFMNGHSTIHVTKKKKKKRKTNLGRTRTREEKRTQTYLHWGLPIGRILEAPFGSAFGLIYHYKATHIFKIFRILTWDLLVQRTILFTLEKILLTEYSLFKEMVP